MLLAWPAQLVARRSRLTTTPRCFGAVRVLGWPGLRSRSNHMTPSLFAEENMYASNPPELATRYPTHIQKLVGYTVRAA